MPQFLEAVTPARAREILGRFAPVLGEVSLPPAEALGRVMASDLVADAPMPAFDRSVMDGYAVRAADTFGASESAPAYLALTGRIRMGEPPGPSIAAGQTREVSTGGALPTGADAVVMVEYCREVGANQVEVTRPVGPGENAIRRGEDIAEDAPVVRRGTRLRPQEMLALAAYGTSMVRAVRRPRVGLLATGDELIPVGAAPRIGQVRDANSAALAAQVVEAGGDPLTFGICRDEPAALRMAVARMIETCDLGLVSGGSSQGARDATAEVLGSMGSPGVLAHGIAVAPGKPTILAACGAKPVLGLPGHPVSSFVIFRMFVNPLVRLLGGESPPREPFPARTRARMGRTVASKPGREDYVRVVVEDGVAQPILGGSGALSTVLRADGLVRIPLDQEGVAEGEEVEVLRF